MFRRVPLSLLMLCSFALPLAAEPDLQCRGPKNGHIGAEQVCASLRPLLRDRTGQVTLELTKDEPMALAARLSWTLNGKSGRGPVVDVTASDRPLDRRASTRLARGLIAVSDLP